jgi:hypothetical protein
MSIIYMATFKYKQMPGRRNFPDFTQDWGAIQGGKMSPRPQWNEFTDIRDPEG